MNIDLLPTLYERDETIVLVPAYAQGNECPLMNCTPHPFDLFVGGQHLRLAPSGILPRRATTTSAGESVWGVPTSITSIEATEGLPAPLPGIYLIVSGLVFDDPTLADRTDLLAPDAAPDAAVRDASGRIVGMRRLRSRLPAPAPKPEPQPAPARPPIPVRKPWAQIVAETEAKYGKREVVDPPIRPTGNFSRPQIPAGYLKVQSWRSQNQQWGVDLFAPGEMLISKYGATLRGWSAKVVGKDHGVFAIVLTRDVGSSVVIDDDMADRSEDGAVIVVNMSLQANGRLSIVNAPPGSRWRCVGYKNRRTWEGKAPAPTLELTK